MHAIVRIGGGNQLTYSFKASSKYIGVYWLEHVKEVYSNVLRCHLWHRTTICLQVGQQSQAHFLLGTKMAIV